MPSQQTLSPSFLGQNLMLDHLPMHVSDNKHPGPHNLSQKQQRQNGSKRSNGLHKSCLYQSPLCHLPRNQRQQHFRANMDCRQISKKVRRQEGRIQQDVAQTDNLGLEGPSHSALTSQQSQIGCHLLGKLFILSRRSHYIPGVRIMDVDVNSCFSTK